MGRKILKKPEVLAPAGTLEKLKTAILYGADAVFLGGEAYGLRSRAGNFDFEEMKEAVEFAHSHNAKVYIAANMVTHEGDEKGAGEFFRTVRDLGIDAAIISDMALMDICASEAPGLPIHLSTQASAANWETLNFWKDEGLERVVLAREVSMAEIQEMQEKVDVEIEAFIHGVFPIQGVVYYQITWYDLMRTVEDVRNLAVGNMVCLICHLQMRKIWLVLVKKVSKRSSR